MGLDLGSESAYGRPGFHFPNMRRQLVKGGEKLHAEPTMDLPPFFGALRQRHALVKGIPLIFCQFGNGVQVACKRGT